MTGHRPWTGHRPLEAGPPVRRRTTTPPRCSRTSCRTSLNIDRRQLSARTAFHEIGVDSLAVRQLLERLEAVFGEIPAEAFFTHKTIGALAG